MGIGWYNLYYGRNEEDQRWSTRKPGRHISAMCLDDFINVHIDEDTIGEMDKVAKAKNLSRARLIRKAVCGLIFAPEYDPCGEAW